MKISSVDDAIVAVGGDLRASEIADVSLDALRKWRRKGCIPPKNWPEMVANSAGTVTYEALEVLWRKAQAAPNPEEARA